MRPELGLRANPFALPAESEAPLHPLPEPVATALDAGARILVVVGANGMGKTTLLRILAAQAASRGESVHHQRCEPDRPPDPPPADWWLLDETQFVPPRTLRALVEAALAEGRRVVLATHVRHDHELRGLPRVTVRLNGLRTDAELITMIAGYLTRAGAADIPITAPAASAWRRIAGGNREAAVRLGYEILEDLDRRRPIRADDVRQARDQLRRDAPEALAWRRREREHRRRR